jgi:hypothetical protein
LRHIIRDCDFGGLIPPVPFFFEERGEFHIIRFLDEWSYGLSRLPPLLRGEGGWGGEVILRLFPRRDRYRDRDAALQNIADAGLDGTGKGTFGQACLFRLAVLADATLRGRGFRFARFILFVKVPIVFVKTGQRLILKS